jgi:hypothetical protein
MLGRDVWRHMTDSPDGALSSNLQQAMGEKVDRVFEHYSAAADHW